MTWMFTDQIATNSNLQAYRVAAKDARFKSLYRLKQFDLIWNTQFLICTAQTSAWHC